MFEMQQLLISHWDESNMLNYAEDMMIQRHLCFVCAEEERRQRCPHQAPQRPLPGGGSHGQSAETGTSAQLPHS